MLHTIEPAGLRRAMIADQAVLIDIREPDEYAREHIPGSRLVPLWGTCAMARLLGRLPYNRRALEGQ